MWSKIAAALSGGKKEQKKAAPPIQAPAPLAYPSDTVKERPRASTNGVWFRIDRQSPGAGISAWSDSAACPYEEAIRVDDITFLRAKGFRGRQIDYSKLPKGDYHSMSVDQFREVLFG